MEAKTPEDIYKTSSTDNRNTFGANVDSARNNLASTFVNAFVNAAFGQDKLMTDEGTWPPRLVQYNLILMLPNTLGLQRPSGSTRTESTA
jgi:hypothetical protein